jgi:hypothetical protein
VMPLQSARGTDVGEDCTNGNDVYDCRQSSA